MYRQYRSTNQTEVSKSQSKLKRYQSAAKRNGETSGFGNISKTSVV